MGKGEERECDAFNRTASVSVPGTVSSEDCGEWDPHVVVVAVVSSKSDECLLSGLIVWESSSIKDA